jgi:hypothetical protein
VTTTPASGGPASAPPARRSWARASEENHGRSSEENHGSSGAALLGEFCEPVGAVEVGSSGSPPARGASRRPPRRRGLDPTSSSRLSLIICCPNTTIKSKCLACVKFPQTCLLYGYQLSSAIAYIHARKILHRDLKPREDTNRRFSID